MRDDHTTLLRRDAVESQNTTAGPTAYGTLICTEDTLTIVGKNTAATPSLFQMSLSSTGSTLLLKDRLGLRQKLSAEEKRRRKAKRRMVKAARRWNQ